jgi:hypothetical protein
MPCYLANLTNADVTIDGTVVAAFKASVYHPGLITDTNVAAAILARTITGVNVDDAAKEVSDKKKVYKYTPLTGVTQAIPNDAEEVYIVPAGTIAALTLTMPPAPYDGQELRIATTQIVTALTHTAPVGTLRGALTAGTANGFSKWKWNAADTTWYRIG